MWYNWSWLNVQVPIDQNGLFIRISTKIAKNNWWQRDFWAIWQGLLSNIGQFDVFCSEFFQPLLKEILSFINIKKNKRSNSKRCKRARNLHWQPIDTLWKSLVSSLAKRIRTEFRQFPLALRYILPYSHPHAFQINFKCSLYLYKREARTIFNKLIKSLQKLFNFHFQLNYDFSLSRLLANLKFRIEQ